MRDAVAAKLQVELEEAFNLRGPVGDRLVRVAKAVASELAAGYDGLASPDRVSVALDALLEREALPEWVPSWLKIDWDGFYLAVCRSTPGAVWTTANGDKLPVFTMRSAHLLNTARFVLVRAEDLGERRPWRDRDLTIEDYLASPQWRHIQTAVIERGLLVCAGEEPKTDQMFDRTFQQAQDPSGLSAEDVARIIARAKE